MTPLIACFPVIMTFTALALLTLVVIATGMANREADDDAPPNVPAQPPPHTAIGPPPWWVVVLIFAAVAAMMFVLAWIWPE